MDRHTEIKIVDGVQTEVKTVLNKDSLGRDLEKGRIKIAQEGNRVYNPVLISQNVERWKGMAWA